MTRIACVACLDPQISVHTPGFLKAVRLARSFALSPDVQVDLYNDDACAAGAARAAQQIIASKPDIVVGHFASSAAQAAAPLYAEAGLPLILPAATRTDLTQTPGTYRICDNDRDYVTWLCRALNGPIHAAYSDGSAHGDSVVAAVQRTTAFRAQTPAETVLLSGLYKPTVALAGTIKARRLVLTDDADMPQLGADLAAAGVDFDRTDVYLGALAPAPSGSTARRIQALGTPPATYGWETIAALQVAAVFKDRPPCFETVLGPLRFDAEGEARPQAFSLRQIIPLARQVAA